jgi:hypothetical protein
MYGARILVGVVAAWAMVMPASAAVELGTGTVNAGIAYYPSPGVTCAATTLQIEGGLPENPTVVAGTGASPYAGWWSFDGQGSSSCETLASGSGTIELWGSGGSYTGGSLACGSLTPSLPPLRGTYLREGAAFTATLNGDCDVNGSQPIPVQVTIAGTWAWELNHAALAGTVTFTEV